MGTWNSRAHGSVVSWPPSIRRIGPIEATMMNASTHVRNRTNLLDQEVTASRIARTSSGMPT